MVTVTIDANRLINRLEEKINILNGNNPMMKNTLSRIGQEIKQNVKNRIISSKKEIYYKNNPRSGQLENAIDTQTFQTEKDWIVGVASSSYLSSNTQQYGRHGDAVQIQNGLGYWFFQNYGTTKKFYQIPALYRKDARLYFYWVKAGKHVAVSSKFKKCDKEHTPMYIDKISHPGFEGRFFLKTKNGEMQEMDKIHIPAFQRYLKMLMSR